MASQNTRSNKSANTSRTKSVNTSINEQEKQSGNSDVLQNIQADLKSLKENVGKTVNIDDIKNIVGSIVREVMSDHKKEMEILIEEKHKVLMDIIDSQRSEIEGLNDQIHVMSVENDELKKLARSAMSKANWNEQYSRKNNVKIHGVKELPGENVKELVQNIIQENAGVEIPDDDIIAIHRIPGRKGYQRPILMKLTKNSLKSRIMKHRSTVKKPTQNGIRLCDDVTQLNGQLINTLLENENVKSAWYFNGRVYGQIGEKRVLFDIFDEIEEKIANVKR